MKNLAIIGLALTTVVGCGQNKTEAALAAQKVEMENEQLRDSIRIVNSVKEQELAEEQLAATAAAQTSQRTVVHHTYATNTAAQEAEAVPEKKKMNNKVKGTLIGAGVGAITGAAVSKDKKGKGAIIGGVVGAGVGLGTGAVLDKREKDKANGQ